MKEKDEKEKVHVHFPDIREVETGIEELLDAEHRRLFTAAQNGPEALAGALDASAAVFQSLRRRIIARLPKSERREPGLYTTAGSNQIN